MDGDAGLPVGVPNRCGGEGGGVKLATILLEPSPLVVVVVHVVDDDEQILVQRAVLNAQRSMPFTPWTSEPSGR